MNTGRQGGFTLIEIMVTVAIVAILTAIAVPNYAAYVQRGKIAEAISNLSTMRVQMEQFFLDSQTYVGGPCTTPPAGTYFRYSCVPPDSPAAPTAIAYTITATGVASMSGFTYTIDQLNNRLTTAFAGVAISPPATCWYTKAGSC